MNNRQRRQQRHRYNRFMRRLPVRWFLRRKRQRLVIIAITIVRVTSQEDVYIIAHRVVYRTGPGALLKGGRGGGLEGQVGEGDRWRGCGNRKDRRAVGECEEAEEEGKFLGSVREVEKYHLIEIQAVSRSGQCCGRQSISYTILSSCLGN